MELEPELLIHAARTGNLQILDELLKGEANLNVSDEKGYTPLMIAVITITLK